VKAGAVTDAGGHGDYGAADEAAHDTGQCAFHAGADDHYASLRKTLALVQQTVNAGHADVADALYFVAHDFGGALRFFEDRKIAGAGANHGDLAFAVKSAIAPDPHDTRCRKILRFRREFGDAFRHFSSGSSQQQVVGFRKQRGGNAGYLIGMLALP